MLFCTPFCLFGGLSQPFFKLFAAIFDLHILEKVHLATLHLAIHSGQLGHHGRH